MITIAEALDRFLAEEKRRAPETAERAEFVLDNLVTYLEGYGYQYVAENIDDVDGNVIPFGDLDEFDDAETGLIDRYGPDVLPDSLGEFLYYWNIRKFQSDEDDARSTGLLMERLMTWLASESLADPQAARQAAAMARTASEDLPRAVRLSDLFYDLAKATPSSSAEPDEVVDDLLQIERIEPGCLWLEAGVGPIAVPEEISRLAVAGWSVNVAAEKRAGVWAITETGYVYPMIIGDEDGSADDGI